MAVLQLFNIIDGLSVSKGWKHTFKLIHTNFYPNYVQGNFVDPHLWSRAKEVQRLTFIERLHLYCRFNAFAFLLGPFYYLAKGMFIKGILLLSLLCPIVLFDFLHPLIILLMLYCAFYANIDYFVHKVLFSKEVLNNPLCLNENIDEVFFYKNLVRPINVAPFFLVAIVLLVPLGFSAYEYYQNNFVMKEKLKEIPKVCTSKKSCTAFIKTTLKHASANKKKTIDKEYYLIACAYYVMNDKYSAINALDLSINYNKKYMPSYLLRASITYNMGNYARSVLDYKTALEMHPRAKFLNYYIGLGFYKMGRYDDALKAFQEATRYTKNDPTYFEAQAYAKWALNDYKGAIADLNRAVKLYKKANSGNETSKTKEIDKSLKKLKEVAKLNYR